MPGTNMVLINGEKLDKILTYKGLTKKSASEAIGRGYSYLNNCIERGRMSVASTKLFKLTFDIDPEDYVVVEEEVQPEPEPAVEAEPVTAAPIEINYNKIREAVSEGVLDAICQMFSDNELRGTLYTILANAHKGGMQMAWSEKLKGAH